MARSAEQPLILRDDVRTQLFDDLTRFLAARELYRRHGAPHKRGVLLHGPPGNGKTRAIRSLVGHLGLSALFVRTLRSRRQLEDETLHTIFEEARRRAPCVLVLEDLDALVTDATRSVFLNELDGMQSNDGLITLATTNHPERLDPALLHRPSRFDVKLRFGLPEAAERRRFLDAHAARLEPDTLDEADFDAIVAASDGASFAQLEESLLGGLMRWVDRGGALVEHVRARLGEHGGT